MRILFSTTNLDLGGAQMFIMRLAEELTDKGHEVFVYNHQPEWSNEDFLKSFSKKVKIISYSENKLILSLVWKINGIVSRLNKKFQFRNRVNERKYRRTLMKYKFDIVHSQMYLSDRINSRVAVPLGIPYVITTHGEYELNFSQNKPEFYKDAMKCLNTAAAVVYTAEKNIDAIRKFMPDNKPVHKILVGFNGKSIPRFKVDPTSLGIMKDDFVIGMVARGIPEKGWKELMEMFEKLKNFSKKKLHLLLIGNGDQLKEQFQKTKSEGMHLLQFTKNPLEYFSWIERFDVGVLFSYFKGESVPNSVIEYLYHGKPVLSTPMGDIKLMISSSNGMAGEMVPLKNDRADTDAAIKILDRWLNDEEYFNELKRNTAAAFQKFDMANVAGQYLDVYKEAMGVVKKEVVFS